MKHEDAHLLSALADSELASEDKSRVESHLKACAACREAFESLRQTKRLLASAPRRAMPPDLVAAIEQRLAGARLSLAWLPRWFQQPRIWAPAGALALATLLMSIWVHVLDRDPDQYVPLEPLLAAHSRYSAESLVPEDNLVASSYSALTYAEIHDQDAD